MSGYSHHVSPHQSAIGLMQFLVYGIEGSGHQFLHAGISLSFFDSLERLAVQTALFLFESREQEVEAWGEAM